MHPCEETNSCEGSCTGCQECEAVETLLSIRNRKSPKPDQLSLPLRKRKVTYEGSPPTPPPSDQESVSDDCSDQHEMKSTNAENNSTSKLKQVINNYEIN